MAYITKDFAATQTRKFTVYCDDKEKADREERARQLQEHRNRVANAEKKKFKRVK